MAKDLPYYRLWVKDFDTNEAVRMLNLPEAGLFLFCLNHAWINDGLPSAPEAVARVLKIPLKEFLKHWGAVSACFLSDGSGRLRNGRQEAERIQAQNKSRQASEAVAERERKRNRRSSSDDLRAYDSDSGSVSDVDSIKTSLPILDDFGRFAEICHAAQLPASESDLRAAKFEWGRLDFQQKLDAVQGLKDRIAAGELADAGFRPLPQNYLKNRVWQRPVRERKAVQAQSKNDRALEILKENLAMDARSK